MKEILEQVLEAIDHREPAALASVVAGKGSLPMSRRSKMLVLSSGKSIGTVGGGCLEAEVHAMASQSIRSGRPGEKRFTLTEAKAGAEGLNCGGTVDILVEPVGERATADAPVYREALEGIARRDETVLVTLLSGPEAERRVAAKGLVGWKGYRAGTGELAEGRRESGLAGDLQEEALAILGQDRSIWLTREGGERAFLETVSAPPTLFLFGGGHVSLAVARAARLAGFRVVVVDDRPAFSNPERFPEADETLVLPMATAFEHLRIDAGSYIVAVTRGHQHDEPVIEQAVRTPAAYIGMLGSRRKVALMWERLKARGVPEAALTRVRAPIGLPIGADTPGEIAISVVAQLIEARRGSVRGKRRRAGEPERRG